MKVLSSVIIFLPICLLLFNNSYIGEKSASLSIIYGATTLLALLLFLGFHFLVHKKDKWFYLLFGSVLVVNIRLLFTVNFY